MTEQLPASYAILRVYDRDGVTLRDELDAKGVAWTDELGGEGSASYTVPFMQRALQANPNLLRDAVVKIAVPLSYGAAPTEIFAWLSNPGSGVLIGDSQEAGKQESPASRGLMAVMDDWILFPENGFRRTSAVARFMGWMSKTGPWYNAGEWSPPTDAYLPAEFESGVPGVSSARFGHPEGWPDPTSYWIWATGGTDKLTLFRTTFTTSVTQLVQIYISADETFLAYLNSEEIASGSATEIGYKDIHTPVEPVVLNPGTHTLSIAMTTIGTLDIGDGADALMVTVYTVGSDGGPATLLRHSDATNWKTHVTTIDGERPGMTAADIIITLMDEAEARGIASMSTLSLSFNGNTDTNGTVWPDLQERNWGIGTSGNSILSDLSETSITFDMSPTFTLDAYVDQGTDRTPNVGCPTLAEGVNLLTYTWQGQPVIATRVMTRSAEAFSMLTDTTAELTYSPRETYIESGTSVSVSQANKVGMKALTEFAKEHRSYTAEIVAKPGCTPYVNFDKGDTIWGLNQFGQKTAVRVLSIGGSRSDEGGYVHWILELREP